MSYKIEILYETGNSFGSHEEITYLLDPQIPKGKYSFTKPVLIIDDIEFAEIIISRIKEHAEWYESQISASTKNKPAPTWRDDFEYDPYFNVEFNNQKYIFYATWVGFFERLIEVKICLV